MKYYTVRVIIGSMDIIYSKHYKEERKIERYREKSQGEALDMLKEYFYYLWD